MVSRYFLFIFFLLPTFIFAQGRFITGRVIDNSTSAPVPDAYIKCIGTGQTAYSDQNGSFLLRADSVSACPIVVSFIGYKTVQIDSFVNGQTIYIERGTVNLDEVFVTTGRTANPFSTISRIDIETQPVKSSQDILRIVPGLFIGQHQGGGKAEQIFLRGFDIDHGTDVSLTVDGMPVNMVSHAHGQGYADLHFLIPELVEKADYEKGPYSVVGGNLATAGHVSFLTRKSLPGSVIKVEGGQFNNYRTVAMIDLLGKQSKIKGTNAYIASEFLYADGAFESPARFNRFNLVGRYNTRLNEENDLSISASLFNSKWDASGQIPERAVNSGMITRFGAIDNTEGGYTGRTNLNIQLHSVLNDNVSFDNNVFYSRYHFNLHSNFTFFLNDSVNGDQIRQREGRNIFGYTGKLSHQRVLSTSAENKSEFAAGFRLDDTQDSELSHTIKRSQVLEYLQLGDIHELNLFVYGEKIYSRNKWTINAGLRLDQFVFGYYDKLQARKGKRVPAPFVSPKLGIQYAANNTTLFYFKTGRGFHSNDTRVLLENRVGRVLPAAYGSDLGVLYKPFPSLYINAAIWYLYLEQEFVYVGDEGIVEPSGRTSRKGIDLSLRYQFNKWLFADFNMNAAKPRSIDEAKGEDYIPLAPTLTGTGGLSFQLQNGFNGSIRYRYLKNRPANENNSVIAKGYTVTDMTINYTTRKFEAGIIIENLFDAEWNETQFNTESRLRNEPASVEEIHFTPGTPFFARLKFLIKF